MDDFSIDSKILLNDGNKMPIIGFGTQKVANGKMKDLIPSVIACGQNHIDTAELYKNEQGIGDAMKKMETDRENQFLTTKVWPGHKKWGHELKSQEKTISACESSLEKLQVDYVDLQLIHAPFAKDKRIEQYKALVELKKRGKVKSIGVSNQGIHHLKEIEDCELPLPAVNQIEVHPQSTKTELIAYMKERNIVCMAQSSLAPLSNWREKGGANNKSAEAKSVIEDEDGCIISFLAGKYAKTEAQILLRWALQHSYVVIPKSTSTDRIKQNVDLFDFNLSDQDMQVLDDLDHDFNCAFPKGMDPTKEL